MEESLTLYHAIALLAYRDDTTARSHGVRFLPGATYSMSGEPTSGVRLGFASLNETELAEAVSRLGISLRA